MKKRNGALVLAATLVVAPTVFAEGAAKAVLAKKP